MNTPNLQNGKWTSNIGSDINKVESAYFEAYNLTAGQLLVLNVGNAADAGGLVSQHLTVPKNGADFYPYAQLSAAFVVPSPVCANLGRLETDLIAVFTPSPHTSTQIRNKANCSTQWNASTGHFEIDASAGSAAWSDIGGGPGKITADVEHSLAIKCAFDLAKGTRSVQCIVFDSKEYLVPSALQGVALQESNWGQVASIQLQNEMIAPGTAAVIYSSIALAWDVKPF